MPGRKRKMAAQHGRQVAATPREINWDDVAQAQNGLRLVADDIAAALVGVRADIRKTIRELERTDQDLAHQERQLAVARRPLGT
jgi:hypothetical protein